MTKDEQNLTASYRRAIRNDPCRYCGEARQGEDHIYPVSKGGRSIWWNLAPACGNCNRAKRDHCGTWFVLKQGLTAARYFLVT